MKRKLETQEETPSKKRRIADANPAAQLLMHAALFGMFAMRQQVLAQDKPEGKRKAAKRKPKETKERKTKETKQAKESKQGEPKCIKPVELGAKNDSQNSNYELRLLAANPVFPRAPMVMGETDYTKPTDACCWQCSHQFDTLPVPMPVHRNNLTNIYRARGIYCSLPCVKRQISVDHGVNQDQYRGLLTLMASELYGIDWEIPFAPHRHEFKKFQPAHLRETQGIDHAIWHKNTMKHVPAFRESPFVLASAAMEFYVED